MTLRFFKPRLPTEADTLTGSGWFGTQKLPAEPRRAPQQPSLVRSVLVGIVGIARYVVILVIGIMIGISASIALLMAGIIH
jgi:hypothetical protein